MAGVTYEMVAEAAERILAEGGKVSVTAVRTALGSGSMSTLTPLLKRWREGRCETPAEEASTVSEAVVATIRQAVDGAIREQVTAETQSLAAELAAKDADLAGYETEIKEQAEALTAEKTRADQAEAEAARLAGALDESQRQAEAVRAQLEALTGDLTAARAQIEGMQAQVAEADKIRIQAAEQAAEKAKFEDKIKALESENTLLKQDTQELRILRQERPALQSKADRYEEMSDRYVQTQEEMAGLRKELAQAREELARARAEAATESARAEANAAKAEAGKELIVELRQSRDTLQAQLQTQQQQLSQEAATVKANNTFRPTITDFSAPEKDCANHA